MFKKKVQIKQIPRYYKQLWGKEQKEKNMKSELTKALEYEKKLQKEGYLKDIRMYIALLDEYASLRGYWSFDNMIQELIND